MIRWWEVDPASALGGLRCDTDGDRRRSGRDVAWPSIATDGDGKLWVNYARAGAGECLAAYASVVQPGASGSVPVLIASGRRTVRVLAPASSDGGTTPRSRGIPSTPTPMATYGAYPFDDGVGGTQTDLWQQVIASVEDT